jgi:hypothetical protein
MQGRQAGTRRDRWTEAARTHTQQRRMAETSCPAFTADSEIRMGMNEQGCHMQATVKIVTNLSEQSIQQHAEHELRLAVNAKRSIDSGEVDAAAAATLADVCDQGIAHWAALKRYAETLLPAEEPEPRPAAMVPPVTVASN